MEAITAAEHEILVEGFRLGMHDLMERLVEDTLSTVRGRTLNVIRKFKDPVTGEFKSQGVIVTVTHGHIGYDGDLVLVGTYPHPFSGTPVETAMNPL